MAERDPPKVEMRVQFPPVTFIMKKKRKRCKNFATYFRIRRRYGLCLRTQVPMDADQDPKAFKCDDYIRKWWKIFI